MGLATIYEDNEKQISLFAEIIDGEVLFAVENEGRLTHFGDINEALKEYVKLNISKTE